MVKHYIFDLDGTLYNDGVHKKNFIREDFYKNFKPNFFLKHVLDNLDGKKYIFTNGTYGHSENTIDKLNLQKHFYAKNTFSRDIIKGRTILKPDNVSFDLFKQFFPQVNNGEVYFFEDTLVNLETAKQTYNWHTIYIGNRDVRHLTFVDYSFPSIEAATLHFAFKKNLNKF